MKYLLIVVMVILCGCSDKCIPLDNESSIETVIERKASEIFDYEVLPATGPVTIPEKGNTAQLLKEVPYLLTANIVPSEEIIKELLGNGISDAGMSGGIKWEPYSLSTGQFPKLVELLIREDPNLEYIEPPVWVQNFDDWHVWIMFHKYEVPWEKHKELNDKYKCIESRMNEAYNAGNDAEGEKLHWESVDVGNKLAEYVMKHTKRP